MSTLAEGLATALEGQCRGCATGMSFRIRQDAVGHQRGEGAQAYWFHCNLTDAGRAALAAYRAVHPQEQKA